MVFYYIYILISLLCIIWEEAPLTDKQRLWNLRIAILPVFILMAFKGPLVGSDTPNYIGMYQTITDRVWYNDLYPGVEPGYNVFQSLLHLISTNPQVLMIAVALITAIGLYYFFRETKYCCIALYLFTTMGFLTFALSGLRQTIAIAIGLLAYKYIKTSKLVPFLLFLLLAYSFHKSALFMIPAYFIANQKIKAKNMTLVFMIILVAFFFADKLLLSIADIMSYDKYGLEATGNGYQFFLIVLMVTIVAINNRRKIIQLNTNNKYIFNINFLSLAMWTIRLVSRTAERVSLYFLPYTVLLMTEHMNTFPRTTRIQLKVVCLIVATYLFLHRIGVQEELRNYMFFFM